MNITTRSNTWLAQYWPPPHSSKPVVTSETPTRIKHVPVTTGGKIRRTVFGERNESEVWNQHTTRTYQDSLVHDCQNGTIYLSISFEVFCYTYCVCIMHKYYLFYSRFQVWRRMPLLLYNIVLPKVVYIADMTHWLDMGNHCMNMLVNL